MQVQCPSCSKVIKAPDEKAGTVVACPNCGGRMQLPAAAAPAAPAAEAGDGRETRRCPYCGETVLAVARKCKHCHSILLGTGPRFKGRARKRRSSGEGTTALVMGIIAIAFCAPIFGPMAILYGNSARKQLAERTTGTIGMVLGIIGLLLFLLFILLIVAGGAAGR